MSKPNNPKKGISRRDFVKGSMAATAAMATVGPWVISSKALASSGELNVLMWSDYLPPDWIAAFTKKTGIKLNYTGIGSNEEIINKMKATKGEGIDICSPTNVRSGQWVDLELLQPWDYSRITNIKNVNPSMLKVGDTEWNFGGKGSHWLPHIWGTEAIGWRTDLWSPQGGIPSYGDVWSDENKGKTMIRPHSGMLGAGLYMETIGELEPGSMWKAYSGEDVMRKIWKKVTDWCIAHKSHIKLFWNDADSQKNGFMNDGVVVGQTWDGPPLALKSAGEPVTYQAPKEGALAWVDGMALSKAAKNVDQAYEFVKFCYMPEPAGKAIDKHGYNSAVMGADKYASAQYKKNFSEAYPGDALSNLNPWPAEPQWYADVRTEFRNKFVNA
ncbi:MAG: extracellular solute-binding protein [Deltaproteobacteria bacterium]|nr:extracellular solute-binding protein [Deltaproteobacteria bacterium]